MRSINERIRGMVNRPFIRKKKRGFAFWSLVTALVLFLLRLVPGIGKQIHLSPWIALLVGIAASLPALFRWVRWRLLWKLRNRLFVTYALIGLTPVVLFGLLAAFAAYVLFGQFANFAAASEIHSELVALSANTDALALHIQQELADQKAIKSGVNAPQLPQTVPPEARNIINIPELQVGVYLDGKLQKLDLPSAHAITTVSTPPAWVHGSFNGLILSGHQVYFAAVTREPVGTHTLFVITGLRLDPQFLGRVVSGLGTMTMWPNVHLQTSLPIADQHPEYSVNADIIAKPDATPATDDGAGLGPVVENEGRDAGEITGGVLPKREDMFDLPINFPTTLETHEWSTGKPTTVFALVTSRPSLLYQRLFQQSLLIGGGVRTALILT
ncbi:MAG: hypothetical protein WBF45_10880, partial [Acidobacteriaceae bacterium]